MLYMANLWGFQCVAWVTQWRSMSKTHDEWDISWRRRHHDTEQVNLHSANWILYFVQLGGNVCWNSLFEWNTCNVSAYRMQFISRSIQYWNTTKLAPNKSTWSLYFVHVVKWANTYMNEVKTGWNGVIWEHDWRNKKFKNENLWALVHIRVSPPCLWPFSSMAGTRGTT